MRTKQKTKRFVHKPLHLAPALCKTRNYLLHRPGIRSKFSCVLFIEKRNDDSGPVEVLTIGKPTAENAKAVNASFVLHWGGEKKTIRNIILWMNIYEPGRHSSQRIHVFLYEPGRQIDIPTRRHEVRRDSQSYNCFVIDERNKTKQNKTKQNKRKQNETKQKPNQRGLFSSPPSDILDLPFLHLLDRSLS